MQSLPPLRMVLRQGPFAVGTGQRLAHLTIQPAQHPPLSNHFITPTPGQV